MTFDRAMKSALEMEVNRILARGQDPDQPGMAQHCLDLARHRAKRIRRDRAGNKRRRQARGG